MTSDEGPEWGKMGIGIGRFFQMELTVNGGHWKWGKILKIKNGNGI